MIIVFGQGFDSPQLHIGGIQRVPPFYYQLLVTFSLKIIYMLFVIKGAIEHQSNQLL